MGDEPELATNEEWRGIMKRARKEHQLSQEELAAKVGCSQVMIAKIESDATASSSKYILAICDELDIPPPQHFENEDMKAWAQLGRVLRAKNRKQYEIALKLVESMAQEAEQREAGERRNPDPEPEQPTRRK
jgi:transcriptional regulator with XRE-family HTH domain